MGVFTKQWYADCSSYRVLADLPLGSRRDLDRPVLAGTIWTCNFPQPNGYHAMAVWDIS